MIVYIIIQDGNLLVTKKLNPLYTKFYPFDLKKCDTVVMGKIKNINMIMELENKDESSSYSYNNIKRILEIIKSNL